MEIHLNLPAATLGEIGKVVGKAGVELHKCYQCGKCTAGCPMAHAMDLPPRVIIHHLQLGLLDEVLHCKAVWICASCHTCSARCPNKINVSLLIEVLRQEAKERNIIPVSDVDTFSKVFLGNIKNFGKSHEMSTAGLYNLSSRHLLQDVGSVPHMLRHRLIGIKPHVVKDRTAVRKLMNKALKGDDKK